MSFALFDLLNDFITFEFELHVHFCDFSTFRTGEINDKRLERNNTAHHFFFFCGFFMLSIRFTFNDVFKLWFSSIFLSAFIKHEANTNNYEHINHGQRD
ncbi:hypothetical protein D3C87_1786250 [compost metagenome]